jgi:hypothetical protein
MLATNANVNGDAVPVCLNLEDSFLKALDLGILRD